MKSTFLKQTWKRFCIPLRCWRKWTLSDPSWWAFGACR
jgi:hypothetical protein